MAAGILSHGTIEVGLIPLGSLGMTVFGIALSLPNLSFDTVLGLLVALGFAAGFFAVPVNALIQRRPDEDKKGSVIAAANLWSFVGVGGAFGVYYVLSHFLHATPAAVFLWASLATLVGTIYVLYLLPEALLRLILFLATHTIYKIDVAGLENIPEKGGALLVANHTTLVDAMFFYATTGRPVRFLMFKDFYEHPLLKPFVKILGIIPISSDQRPREMIHSLRAATEAIRNGDLLCIFPEGQMTRIGQMLPFRRGMERIMKGVDAPIIPGASRWRMGIDVQFFGRPVSVEISAQISLSDSRHVWPRASRRCHFAAGARSCAGSGGRCVRAAQAPHEHRSAFADSHRAPASISICNVRHAHAAIELRRRAGENSFSRATSAKTVGRSKDGRYFAAAFHSRRACKFCGDACRENSGESELHRIQRSFKKVRGPVRFANCRDVARILGKSSSRGSGGSRSFSRISPKIPDSSNASPHSLFHCCHRA